MREAAALWETRLHPDEQRERASRTRSPHGLLPTTPARKGPYDYSTHLEAMESHVEAVVCLPAGISRSQSCERGPEDLMSMKILHSGSKGQHKGDSRNHGL